MPVRFHRADEEAAIVPSGPLFTNNGDVVVPKLAAGGRIAMLPDFIAETELASGALVRILADWSLPQVFLHLLPPPSRPRPARVRAISDHLAPTPNASCLDRDSRVPTGISKIKQFPSFGYCCNFR